MMGNHVAVKRNECGQSCSMIWLLCKRKHLYVLVSKHGVFLKGFTQMVNHGC